MMSTRLKIWKRLISNQLPLSGHCPSILISPLSSLPFYAKPHIKLANFCNQMTTPSTTPPERSVVTDFLMSKCGLTQEDIPKAFTHCKYRLRGKSTQNMEEVLELLKGCGFTIPAQVRRVVLCNPKLLFCRSERNVKSKLSLLRTFMKEEDIFKLVRRNAMIFNTSEDTLKSRISLLQRLGVEGETLSHLVWKAPRLLRTSEEKVMDSFKLIENLGLKKGSKPFAAAVQVILGQAKETVERRLHSLNCLGFSEKQISVLCSRDLRFLALKEERLKRKVDFLVNYVGLPLATFMTYPNLFTCSLEKRIIPRYRVMEALKSMQVQELKGIPSPVIFNLTDKRFFEKYVNDNAESSILRDIYHGGKAGKFMIDSIKEIHGSSESSAGLETRIFLMEVLRVRQDLRQEFSSALIYYLKYFVQLEIMKAPPYDSSMVSLTQKNSNKNSCNAKVIMLPNSIFEKQI